MNVHHKEKCQVVKPFICKPFGMTYAWLTRSEGQGQHLFLRQTQQPTAGSRSCSRTWQLRSANGAGQWRGSVPGQHRPGGTTSGQQTSTHLHFGTGCALTHIHPGTLGSTLQTVCFLSAFTARTTGFMCISQLKSPESFSSTFNKLESKHGLKLCVCIGSRAPGESLSRCSAQGSTSQI